MLRDLPEYVESQMEKSRKCRAEWDARGNIMAPIDFPAAVAAWRELYESASLPVVMVDSPAMASVIAAVLISADQDHLAEVRSSIELRLDQAFDWLKFSENSAAALAALSAVDAVLGLGAKHWIGQRGPQAYQAGAISDQDYKLFLWQLSQSLMEVVGIKAADLKVFHPGSISHPVQPAEIARAEFQAGQLNRVSGNKFTAASKVLRSCGFAVACSDFVLLIDNPESCNLDDRGRLHCESGPAVLWKCGDAEYFWQGIRVTQLAIMYPDKITPEMVMEATNAELRRVLLTRMGWIRMLDASGAALIDSAICQLSSTPERLYRLTIGWRAYTIFRVLDPSTGREYGMEVPGDLTTCEQAQRYISHGLQDYIVSVS
jgi:hypothetical protein